MSDFRKFNIKHSTKNIPCAKQDAYKEALIQKSQHLIRRMRWKAKFFEEEDQVAAEEHETYGFKTTRTPKPIQHLQAFEEDLFKMVQSVEFRTSRIRFQNELLKTVRDITEDFNENVLNVKSCLFALREFRNFKWFQTSAIDFPFCLEIIRIFKDIVRKNREWRNLKNFTIELLVTRLLKTMQSEDVTLANCFRRVLEAIAGGLFLEDGNGVLDPCENTQIDGADLINEQNSEELTFAAQIALRQAAFGQSHKLLGIKEVNLVS